MHTKLLDDDFVHSMPVSQMGNYQEYLKRMTPPLREIESAPVRQHMFGKDINLYSKFFFKIYKRFGGIFIKFIEFAYILQNSFDILHLFFQVIRSRSISE